MFTDAYGTLAVADSEFAKGGGLCMSIGESLCSMVSGVQKQSPSWGTGIGASHPELKTYCPFWYKRRAKD